ncbi:MAG: HepT-like ribonuclease domain-containing protein [Desulfobacterales bacterium]
MKDEIKKLLFDIYEAADSIFRYLDERRDFSEYQKNKMLHRAVEREFEIIGEAMNSILKIDPDFPIRQARRIISLRNLVIHGYDKVDNAIIWGIINRDLLI